MHVQRTARGVGSRQQQRACFQRGDQVFWGGTVVRSSCSRRALSSVSCACAMWFASFAISVVVALAQAANAVIQTGMRAFTCIAWSSVVGCSAANRTSFAPEPRGTMAIHTRPHRSSRWARSWPKLSQSSVNAVSSTLLSSAVAAAWSHAATIASTPPACTRSISCSRAPCCSTALQTPDVSITCLHAEAACRGGASAGWCGWG